MYYRVLFNAYHKLCIYVKPFDTIKKLLIQIKTLQQVNAYRASFISATVYRNYTDIYRNRHLYEKSWIIFSSVWQCSDFIDNNHLLEYYLL